MAAHTIDDGENGVYEQTTVADTLDTVQLTDKDSYRELTVKLWTNGASSIFYRTDGEDAEVGDQACRYIPGAAGEADIVLGTEEDTISLISADPVEYSVYKE